MKHIKLRNFAIAAAAILALGSCREDIGMEARYTFTGHTIASFLEENEEVYSSFIHILNKGGRLSLMKAYGQYTCFAPTNDAIEQYLFEQDSIYWTSVEANQKDQSVKVVWTGVTSPELSELSDSMCKVLSQTHLIPAVYLTTDMEGDIIPVMNMNDRYLSLGYDVDENGLNILLINGNGEIIGKDEEVQNGVVHTIASVLNPSTNTVPAQIEAHDYFSIISEAIELTGYADQLQLYKDESYTDGDLKGPSIYKTQQVPYPANRYYGFTAFLEPDAVYHEEGIYNFNDLAAKCKEWYPEANASAPLTSPENPVNQFVGYHLLDRKLPYSRLAHYKINPHSNYNSEKDFVNYADRNEFYETMSGKLMKITMPRSRPMPLQTTILLNYSRHEDPDFDPFMNVTVYKHEDFMAMDSTYANFSSSALNGYIHPIDKILIYNEDVMAGRVLNMIIRFDASSLCSELTNNNIRWNFFTHTSDGEVFIPHTYCKNLKVYSDETHHYYLSPHHGWANFQGDEMMTLDAFDFAYKLPPVPAGTYEIRMGYTANSLRHVIQFYVDNEVAGIPVDLRISTDDPKIGFVLDSETEDNGIQNDKEMKNRGYLKGPTTIYGTGEELGRNRPATVRVVVTTKYLSEGEHWIRFKNVNENDDGKAQFMHDYFEIVPMTFIRDESLSLEEKRK